MIVTIENRGFLGNLALVDRCHRQWADAYKNRSVLHCRGPISATHLMGLIGNRKTMGSLMLWLPVEWLWFDHVQLHNTSGILRLGLQVRRKLTKIQKRRICKLQGVVPILDTSEKNHEFYEQNPSLLVSRDGGAALWEADLLRVAAGLEPAYTRPGLGEGVFIDRDGKLTPDPCCMPSEEMLCKAKAELAALIEAKPSLSELPLHRQIAVLAWLCGVDECNISHRKVGDIPQSDSCAGCSRVGKCVFAEE